MHLFQGFIENVKRQSLSNNLFNSFENNERIKNVNKIFLLYFYDDSLFYQKLDFMSSSYLLCKILMHLTLLYLNAYTL